MGRSGNQAKVSRPHTGAQQQQRCRPQQAVRSVGRQAQQVCTFQEPRARNPISLYAARIYLKEVDRILMMEFDTLFARAVKNLGFGPPAVSTQPTFAQTSPTNTRESGISLIPLLCERLDESIDKLWVRVTANVHTAF